VSKWIFPPVRSSISHARQVDAAAKMRRLQSRLADLREADTDFDRARIEQRIEGLMREALGVPGAAA